MQTGSRDDIVLHPADTYVAEFVQHMNPLNVLRAGAVMRRLAPDRPGPAEGPMVAPETVLRDVIALRQRSGQPVLIGDGEGVVGSAATPRSWRRWPGRRGKGKGLCPLDPIKGGAFEIQ